jgi:hypothetical protein
VTANRQNLLRQLRALGAVFAFLFGACLAPFTLAAQVSQDVCAMACCISEGHCCCKPAKPSVQGQKRDKDETQFVKQEVSKPCSEDCAAARSTSNLFPRAFVQTASSQFTLTATAAIHAPPVASIHGSAGSVSSPPRAPPSFL